MRKKEEKAKQVEAKELGKQGFKSAKQLEASRNRLKVGAGAPGGRLRCGVWRTFGGRARACVGGLGRPGCSSGVACRLVRRWQLDRSQRLA